MQGKIEFTPDRVNQCIDRLVEEIRKLPRPPEAVIGIHPGGYVPATILARALSIPRGIITLDNKPFNPNPSVRSVVLIIDHATNGTPYSTAEQKIIHEEVEKIYRAALVAYHDSYRPRLVGETLPQTQRLIWKSPSAIFPWTQTEQQITL